MKITANKFVAVTYDLNVGCLLYTSDAADE